MASKKVCLVCLKMFHPVSGVQHTGYKVRLLSPLSGLAVLSKPTDEDHHDLYTRFLNFSNRFLQVQSSQKLLAGVEELKQNEEGDLTYAFCGECFETVSAICDLYAELKTVELHLLWKLGSLPEAINNSNHVSLKLTQGLMETLTTQLNAGLTCLIDEFRKKVAIKSALKVNTIIQRPVVHLGVFPEHSSHQNYSKKSKIENDGDERVFAKRRRQPRIKSLQLDTIKSGNGGLQMNVKGVSIITETDEVDLHLDEQNSFEDDGPMDTHFDDVGSDPDWSPDVEVGAPTPTYSKVCQILPPGSEAKDNLEDINNLTQMDTECDNEEEEIDKDNQNELKIKKTKRKLPNSVQTVTDMEYSCKQCDKKFQKLKALSSHLLLDHCTKLNYSCPTCGIEFETITDMRFHERKTHKKVKSKKRKGKTYKPKPKPPVATKCPFCEKIFPSKKTMMIHRKLTHNTRASKHECPVCFKTIIGKDSFDKHRKDHEQNRIKDIKFLYCEACGKRFKGESTLNMHMCNVHDSSFPCVECNTKYATPKDLRDHLETHETDEKSFFCTFCFKGFTNQQYCDIHRGLAHISDHGKFYCDKDKCTEAFKTIDDLNQHLQSHVLDKKQSNLLLTEECGTDKEANNLEGLHICSQCGWGFYYENNLRFHSLVHTPHSKNGTGYDCPICETNVRYMETLLTHYNRVHGGNIKPYRCNICMATFTSPIWYKIHMKLHNERNSDETYNCEICGAECPDSVSLNSHRRTLHGVKVQRQVVESTCEICDEVFHSAFLLRKHMERTHEDGDEKSFFCCFCDQAFCLAQTLKLHEESSHKGLYNKFECDDVACDDIFATVKELNEHLKTHENSRTEENHDGNNIKPETDVKLITGKTIKYCGKCNWGFLDENCLEFHSLIHIANVGGKFTCPGCSREFDAMSKLRKHYSKSHGKNLKKFECSECGKNLFSKGFLALHMKSHEQNEKTRSWVCDICGAACKTPYTLTIHRKRHDSANHFPCSECGKKFIVKKQLEGHMTREHGIGELYPCPVCGLTFVLLRYVKQHMEVHEQGKHECHICHKCFRRPYDLRKHMDIHNPDRPRDIICSECGMTFVSKLGLHWHMGSIHTPEESYRFKCPHCPKRCHRKELLKLHVKTCAKSLGIDVNPEAPSTYDSLSASSSSQATANNF